MFLPTDKVILVNECVNNHEIKAVIIETHINENFEATYITSHDWSKIRTENELLLITQGNWHLKRFVKEFYPGERVLWNKDGITRISVIKERIYNYKTSRILYKLDCGLISYASYLNRCEGGI